MTRELAKSLECNFPERLQRLVVYPVPSMAMWVWRVVQQFLDPNTRDKVTLLTGSAKRGSPCPKELAAYVDYDQIHPDRRARHASLQKANLENTPANGNA